MLLIVVQFFAGLLALYMAWYTYKSNYWASNSKPIIDSLGISIDIVLPIAMCTSAATAIILCALGICIFKMQTNRAIIFIAMVLSVIAAGCLIYFGNLCLVTADNIEVQIDLICNGGFP